MPVKERGTLGGMETKTVIGIMLPAYQLRGHGRGGGEMTTAARVVKVGGQKTGAKSSF